MKPGFFRYLICVIEFACGIILLVDPLKFLSEIMVVGGVLLCICGIISIVKYILMEEERAEISQGLFKGIILVSGGAFCALRSDWFVLTFYDLTAVYGAAIFAAGAAKVQNCANMFRFGQKRWYLLGIGAVLQLAIAVVMIANPFVMVQDLWRFSGIAIMMVALIDFLCTLVIRNIDWQDV